MKLVADIRNLLDFDSPNRLVRLAWERLNGLPWGKKAFTRLIGFTAPYTGTLGATVVELRHGHAAAELTDRRAVRNHLRSIHAIALANLAEMTAGVALAYSIPERARLIPVGLSIEYIAKARGTIRAVCECPEIATDERREYLVPVSIFDEGGRVVCKATLRTLIGPPKAL